jgi:hypothetical protein
MLLAVAAGLVPTGTAQADEEAAAAENNAAYSAKLGDGRTATLAWDENTNEVVTMYVDGDVSNDWAACAETIGA